MAASTIDQRRYYVYALYREDGTPFYVGMGKDDRWVQHERHAHRQKPSHKNNLILKMLRDGLTTIPKEKLYENLTQSEAIAIEIETIANIGRSPDGPLLNATRGGEGILGLSAEAMAARAASIAAALRRPETGAKLSAAFKGRKLRPKTPEERAALSSAVRGFRHTDEAKAKISAASKRQTRTSETTAKYSATRRANHRGYGPEMRAKLAIAMTGRKPSQEQIEKQRVAMTGFRHTPETIERMRQVQKNKSVETRGKLALSMRALWATPEHRAKIQSARDRKRVNIPKDKP